MATETRLRIADAIKEDARVIHHLVIPERFYQHSMSRPADRAVAAPAGETDLGLLVLAHECGHVANDDDLPHRERLPLVKQEIEATAWAFDRIRHHGGIVTAEMEKNARHALYSYTHSPSDLRADPRLYPFLCGGITL